MSETSGKIFETSFKILERDLDTFGHVNNATYLTFYEQARWQFIDDNGYGLKEIMVHKKGPVILEVNVKFKKEIKLRETIKITSQLKERRGKVMIIHQKMINKHDEIASEADFTFGFFDLKERKLIDPTPEWLKAVGLD